MNLDDLQHEVEKLLSLLKDRQGTATWHDLLADHLIRIMEILRKAGQ